MQYKWLFSFAIALLGLPAAAADSIWIEGESLASPPAGFKSGGWGHTQYLSGGKWLFANIDGKEAEALPAEGLTLSFPFQVTSAGNYETWARIGYEFARSPMRWRIDDGDWTNLGPDTLTTDLMDVAEWAEIAWVQLGKKDLAAGKHKLQIKFERNVLPGKKQPERILAGLDCFCLSNRPFRPHGPFRPDADWKRDVDRQAEKQSFEVSADKQARLTLPLDGLWQIARWDEQEIKDRAEPVKQLPTDMKHFYWSAIKVPGNRDTERPELLYCHRFLYRTRLKTFDTAGKTAVLRFPSTALIASVFVNDRFCGGNDTPCAAWEVDITEALKPNSENEIIVAIKDCYYALEQAGDGKSIRTMFNYPTDWFYNKGGLGPTRYAEYPVLFQVRGAGIFETPELIVTGGPAFVADVFARPSVAKGQLELDVTIHNSSPKPLRLKISNQIVPLGKSAVEKAFDSREIELAANAEVTVELAEKWQSPRLWWPDNPQQYECITQVSLDEHIVDVLKTKFGFREWGWSEKAMTLNGVPWHFHADLLHNGALHHKDLNQVVNDWKASGVNTVRYWGANPWLGKSQRDTLDFYDRVGMPIRRTGTFDGQIASYLLAEQKNGKNVARRKLFDNCLKQMKAWVRAERNHPSVFVWSLENEITYINARNLGWLDPVEPEIRRLVQEVMKVDPTRPAMIDGGDALRDRSLPIYGNHYNEANFRHYPDEAYTMDLAFNRQKQSGGWTPWTVGDDRPLFLGETFFASGFAPAAFSAVMGESAFLGRSAAEPGVHLMARMLAEGYRWHGIAGFHFWFSGETPRAPHYNAFQPVCVLMREWDSAFDTRSTVRRTLKVLNDTRLDAPIEVEITSGIGSAAPTTVFKRTFQVAPGGEHEFPCDFKIPSCTDDQEMKIEMLCRRGGELLFRARRDWHILGNAANQADLKPTSVHVLDPKGCVKQYLEQNQITFTAVESFDSLPDAVELLVVGPDALTPRQATDSRWQALAAKGGRIIVLDQANPLSFQAIPADLEPTPNAGRIAFPENLEHELMLGLRPSDFFCRSGDHVAYRNVYRKASRGAQSLLQCDDELSGTALALCPVDKGILVLCQATVGSKLETDAVARRLFANLLRFGARYKTTARQTAAAFSLDDPRLKTLDAAGLKYTKVNHVLEALADEKNEIVVADASQAALAALAGKNDLVQKFTERGGQLMLWGLTDEGLANFNRIVGVTHSLRPFRMERVTLAAKRDPLAAGLSNRDVALEGTEKIYPWAGDRYPAQDTFTHIVSLDDIAPFGKSNNADGWSRMTNGLTSADSWKFIFYHNLKDLGAKPRWEAQFAHEEELERFTIVINTHYHRITKLRLIFDDKESDAVTLDIKPEPELRQEFPLQRRFQKIAIEPVAWQEGNQPVVGVDNLWLTVKRSGDYKSRVAPLLNIGGLVKYRMGKGIIVLNQLRIQTESNPINAEKKQTIVATLLHNMGASFAAEKPLIAGANLTYQPIPLEDKCNQFLTADKGWIEGQPDLAQFPVGNQKLGGVNYQIRDFKTSPLPSCIMLAGPGAKGQLAKAVSEIPVSQKADVLFFLHAFHRMQEWRSPQDKMEPPPVVFVYVINYTDGSKVEVPVRYDRGVSHWLSPQPKGVPEATVAWSAPLPNNSGQQAVVHQMMWKNPRPAATIRSIDVKYDDKVGGRFGLPIVLGVTAGMSEP